MKKILFISNIAKRVGSFSVASIAAAKELGFEFYYAANWSAASLEQRKEDELKYGIHLIHIDLDRSPYSIKNYKALKQLIAFIKDEKIDYIHCNTPVGGVLGRIAGFIGNVKKVIYQAHGFHFWSGAPLKNWLIYYPIEWILACFTDGIITINREDYERALKFPVKKDGKVYYVPGVGIDYTQYALPGNIREKKRKELGLNTDDIALISMGDLISRKNYRIAIESIAKSNNNKLHYFICGRGPLENDLKKLADKFAVDKQVHFLGYRSDVKELLKATDIFLFTSMQEGLARSLMEAMASGLPCIASKIRGNVDLLDEELGGFLCKTNDVDSFAEKIRLVASNKTLREKMCNYNLETIKEYSVNKVKLEIKKIYIKVLS